MGHCVPLPYERWQNAFAYTTEPAVDRAALHRGSWVLASRAIPAPPSVSAGGDCHGLCLFQDIGHEAVRFGAISRVPRNHRPLFAASGDDPLMVFVGSNGMFGVAERHETSLAPLTFSVLTRPTPARPGFLEFARAARPV